MSIILGFIGGALAMQDSIGLRILAICILYGTGLLTGFETWGPK